MQNPFRRWASHARIAAIAVFASLLLVSATVVSPAFAALGNCQSWDGGGGTTNLLDSSNPNVTTGNAYQILGIRFKAEGTNPVFTSWEFNQPYTGTFSFYLHDWSSGTLLTYHNAQSITGSTTINSYIYPEVGQAQTVALTSGHEYIASVYVPAHYTIDYHTTEVYPSALARMSVTTNAAWYYDTTWPPSWNNEHGAGTPQNWNITPIVCQDV